MSVAALKQVMIESKLAERLADDEDRVVPGKTEVYPKPPGRKDGLDAKWGDKPAPPMTFGSAAVEAAEEGRENMVERLFAHGAASSTAEKALLREAFNPETVNQGHTPHSALLRRGHTKLASGDETLMETVKRVTGLR